MQNNGTRVLLEHTDIYLNCHANSQCRNEYCTMHNRSNHNMREFPQHWRGDRGFMERICTHGIGHPDPDDIADPIDTIYYHGCDGCCRGAYNV